MACTANTRVEGITVYTCTYTATFDTKIKNCIASRRTVSTVVDEVDVVDVVDIEVVVE
ncbi:MAG: hypothetical protein ARM1_0836 [Candidatus Micrarchaeota archaeon]|nr:MAG: hypothetical protein ARM1_0836 [Candidatus Micrarchaeota archaeon]